MSYKDYAKEAADKWLTNLVIPQVYDESLSYYEEMNKMIGFLNQVANNITQYARDLQEEAEARKRQDEYLNGRITDEIRERLDGDTELTNKITHEETERELADNRLTDSLNSEISRATTKENEITLNLGTETEIRTSEDAKLKSLIVTNKEDADQKIETVNTLINNEISNRELADNVINTTMDAKEATLNGKIDDERKRATEKEAINAGNITTEKANRISADEEITQKITDEKTRAEKSELDLSKMINAAQNRAPSVETVQEAEKLTVFEIAKHFDNDGKQTKKEITTPVKMQLIDDAGIYYEMALTSYDDLVALKKLVEGADNLADLGANAMELLTSSFHKDTSGNVDTIYIETFNNSTGEVTR